MEEEEEEAEKEEKEQKKENLIGWNCFIQKNQQ